MVDRSPIPYQTAKRGRAHEDQDGVIGFGLGLVSVCGLLALVLSVRYKWNRNWPPLLLVAGFVAAVLGLIAAVPAFLQRERRRAMALCAIIVNVLCLLAQLILLVLYKSFGGAG